MSFTSASFFLFFPAALLLYYALPGLRLQKLVLLLLSYVFYLWSIPKYGLLLLASTLVSYYIGLAIDREWHGQRKLWLVLGCVFQFGLLFAYKYIIPLLGVVLKLLPGGGQGATLPQWLLPAGISFFTFAITGYLFDVYRKKLPAAASLLDYSVFVAFFPCLLSGPIGKAREFLPQLRERHSFTLSQVKGGVLRFLFGLFEKMVVADTIGLAVNRAYGQPLETSAMIWALVVLLYSMQIYFDFAGYSHMAIGVATALDFQVPENFQAPYLSTSVRDFWKKWHISLTSWFREYLYFPLGGSRKGRWRTSLNILIVFAVSGLWHGAARTYLCWGLLNGLLQVAELWAAPRKGSADPKPPHFGDRLLALLQGCVTYFLISVTWVFFRAESLSQVWVIGSRLLLLPTAGWGGQGLLDMGWSNIQAGVLLVSLLLCFLVDLAGRKGWTRQRLADSILPYYLIVGALIVAVCLFGVYGAGFDPQEFVYFKY